MKNIIKKMFSLLLVGVVAVSMFGFIAPNRVGAEETNVANNGMLYFESGRRLDAFNVKFCVDYASKIKREVIVQLNPNDSISIPIPLDIDSVVLTTPILNVINPKVPLYRQYIFTKLKDKSVTDMISISLKRKNDRFIELKCRNQWGTSAIREGSKFELGM